MPRELHYLRGLFEADANGVALLNHGGFGRVEGPVKLAQISALARVEAAPNRFFSHTRGYE
jgi:hypothetical protein